MPLAGCQTGVRSVLIGSVATPADPWLVGVRFADGILCVAIGKVCVGFKLKAPLALLVRRRGRLAVGKVGDRHLASLVADGRLRNTH